MKILSTEQTKEITKQLKNQFGIEKIPGLLVQRGERRISLFQGSLDKTEIQEIDKLVPVEGAGIYFGSFEKQGIRLSIEGTQLLKNQIKKNIFELNSKQLEKWMLGEDLQIKTGSKEFLVMKYEDNLLGCGKASSEKIGNFIPKSRRLKYKE